MKRQTSRSGSIVSVKNNFACMLMAQEYHSIVIINTYHIISSWIFCRS